MVLLSERMARTAMGKLERTENASSAQSQFFIGPILRSLTVQVDISDNCTPCETVCAVAYAKPLA